MIDLIVGRTKSGKSRFIKSKLESVDKPIIILDFKDEYTDIDGKVINLGLINPFLSTMTYRDSIAINAGLIEYSKFLINRTEEVLKDFCPDNNWETYAMKDLIEESLIRSMSGWDPHENIKAKESKRFLDFKKTKQESTLEKEIEKVNKNDIVIVKTEGLHSIETRILTFLLLSRLQEKFSELTLISDNINYLWRDGHLFLFSQIFNFQKNNLILSFNKSENFPNKLKNYINDIYIFQLENNTDIQFFKELGIPIDSSSKRFRKGKYIKHNLNLLAESSSH